MQSSKSRLEETYRANNSFSSTNKEKAGHSDQKILEKSFTQWQHTDLQKSRFKTHTVKTKQNNQKHLLENQENSEFWLDIGWHWGISVILWLYWNKNKLSVFIDKLIRPQTRLLSPGAKAARTWAKTTGRESGALGPGLPQWSYAPWTSVSLYVK